MNKLSTLYKRVSTQLSSVISALPILVLMPHSSCNCRCVMCDIWKANANNQMLGVDILEKHIDEIINLGVKWVVLSGGEALLHPNLWTFCKVLKDNHIKVTILSTGILLSANAENVLSFSDEVIVSLDGSCDVHNTIRNVPRAYEKMRTGISAIKSINPDYRITARSVIQRLNYKDFPNILKAAHELDLDQISFLAADVSSSAFNRKELWAKERVSEVALSLEETEEFSVILEKSIVDYANDFESKFIAERPGKLRKIVSYYSALNGKGKLPEVSCNAPWVSAVIESDGSVLPCYFHKAYGNIHAASLKQILNSPGAISFRKELDVNNDPVCRRCVCSLKLGLLA